ncbi:MAG: phosphocarrier protein HPr [Actinomycetota bacterium]|nr:phosphocarrier protein HPr [Actinomycetota bacterium]
MAQRTVVIASRIGLHARPAAVFAKAAAAAGTPVTIRKDDGAPVPAASILSVLALGVNCGDEVTIEADGDQADGVLDDLAALLARDLDADPA